MATPYEILGVNAQATDEEIKKAYLAKVREFPPEQAAEAFQRIRQAYERIMTQKDRLRYALFGAGPPDVAAELLRGLGEAQTQRVDANTLAKALVTSAMMAKP